MTEVLTPAEAKSEASILYIVERFCTKGGTGGTGFSSHILLRRPFL